MANGKWQIKCEMRNAKCEMRNVDARCQLPDARELRGERINLLIQKRCKGGVPLFEERGTAFRVVVFRINIFRANDFLLELSFSGGGEFST